MANYKKRPKRPVLRKYFLGRRGFKAWPIIFLVVGLYYLGFDLSNQEDLNSLNESADWILDAILPVVYIVLLVVLVRFVFVRFRGR